MRLGVAAGTAGVLLGVVALARAETTPPTKVVGELNAALLATLRDAETLGYQGRFDRLAAVIGRTYDIDLMAEKSLGRHWKTLADADRTRWTALFRDYTTAIYAANLDHFSDQRFDVLGEEPSASETVLVRTRVVDPGAADVDLNYRLHDGGSGWKIVDVYLKGTISELALRRSDFTSVLERDGFEVLVTTLRGKIADLAAGRAKRPRS